jgi:hypothetical protein
MHRHEQSTDWIRSERTPPFVWVIRFGGPAVTVAMLPLALYLSGFSHQFGYPISAAIVGGLVAAELAMSALPISLLTAKAVKIVPRGVEVLPS